MTDALIRSEVLFPLGLDSVELSLCQTISVLRIPEAKDAVEAIANLKAAFPVLDRVYSESGFRYGHAVSKCLFWLETRSSTADDEEFQLLVFQNIITPPVEDLRDFEGRSRIH
ncbi:uncharacterized protein A1O5_05494 [Cladophialophora psammophila CBS 110553]|uniref:Uncharacterized protein n=1 Tax=Cladophialophora psammophila CBS 110553 TaxID=1182543 RepID=W9X426_9EURO|nr:uncharacterized protein A1O5_05494 [Cladophialophora psammophila CBS 110553]EXJ71686.1 hypothetical protein A1O5_05494 [Cladophialophora psammophila CBS 110553]